MRKAVTTTMTMSKKKNLVVLLRKNRWSLLRKKRMWSQHKRPPTMATRPRKEKMRIPARKRSRSGPFKNSKPNW